MTALRRLLAAAGGFCCLWLIVFTAAPAAAATAPQITFDTFNAVYYLSRDSHGLSLLTTDETIVADFPASGFTGITRSLPTSYQGHSVNVKILTVTDAAGNTIPYTSKPQTNGDLLLTIGDPSITLSGPQTIHLNYQTSGVINLNQTSDTFELDVNGRGWGAPFTSVSATLNIPHNLVASLRGKPACYTALGSGQSSKCQISTADNGQATIINAGARPVAAHQTLIVKVGFRPATFTNPHSSTGKIALEAAGAVLTLMIAIGIFNMARKQSREQ